MGVAQHRDVLASAVEDVGVDFVAQHDDVGPVGQPGGEAIQLLRRCRAAGRVGGAVEDDQAGALVDLAEHLLGVEGEAVLLAQRDRHGRRARVADQRFVDREAGIGVEDFRAGFAHEQDGAEHDGLGAGRDQHGGGIDALAVAALEIVGDRHAQFGDAGGGGVAVPPVGQRLAAGVDDVGGRLEVGLPDAQVDDAAALGGELIGARQHLEGGFGAHSPDGGDRFDHRARLVSSRSGEWGEGSARLPLNARANDS